MIDPKYVDQFLQFRNTSKGKAVIYIIIPDEYRFTEDGSGTITSISIARPKEVMSPSDFDGFLSDFLKYSEFRGPIRLGGEHPIWKNLVTMPEGRQYYSFVTGDAKVEMTALPMDAIIPKNTTPKNT